MSAPRDEQPARHRNDSLLVTAGADRRWGEWAVLLVLVAVFAVVDPLLGTAAGLVTVTAWVALGTPYAVASGTLLLLALTPEGADLLTVTLVGGGLVALVVAPARSASQPLAYVTAVVFSVGLLGGLTWGLVVTRPLWLAAALVVGVGLLGLSLLSRYTQLRLGLLGEDTSSEPETERQSETGTAGS